MTENLKNYKFNFLFNTIIFENIYKIRISNVALVCGLFILNFKQLNTHFLDAPRPWQMSFQQPATPVMEAIIDLHHNIMLIMIFIVIFISYILIKAVWLFNSKKRGVSEIPKLSKTRHYLSLEVIWTIIPMIILFFISVPSFALLYSMDNCPKPELTFKVVGRQWYWSYESDFFIKPTIATLDITKINYKLNLSLLFFSDYLINSLKTNNFKNYLNNSFLSELLDTILVSTVLKDKTNLFFDEERTIPYTFEYELFHASFMKYFSNLMYNTLFSKGVEEYKNYVKLFSDINLDVEEGSTSPSLEYLEKSNNFLDFLKYRFYENEFNRATTSDLVLVCYKDLPPATFLEILDFKARIVTLIKYKAFDLDYGINEIIKFIRLDEKDSHLELELRRILTTDILEDINNSILYSDIGYDLNTRKKYLHAVHLGYYCLDKSPEVLKIASLFERLWHTTFSLASSQNECKGYKSFMAYINFLADENSYKALKKSLDNENLSLLSLFKIIIDWHKNLWDILTSIEESPLVSILDVKKIGISMKEHMIFWLQKNNLSITSEATYKYTAPNIEVNFPEKPIYNFVNKRRVLTFALFYYDNFYTEFNITNINDVCNLFNMNKVTTYYFKQILTCNFYFKSIFSDAGYVKALVSSFKSYHKIIPMIAVHQKSITKSVYNYKHISVDFDSCIVSDNDVYKIFNALCINDDKLDLDTIATDFCGWYRLLETDKHLVLPIKTRIRLLVTSSDVLHSWAVPSLGVKIDACPGRLNCVYIYIKRDGLFYGQCSELCGVKHGFMPINVRGVSKDKFDLWVSSVGEFVQKSSKLIN